MKAEYGAAWDNIAKAYDSYKPYAEKMFASLPMGSRLVSIALNIVRLNEETKKPDGERLREYATASLPALEHRLYSPAPISDSLEVLLLKLALEDMQRTFGADDAVVKQILNGKTPEQAAEYYVTNSKLKDVAERKRLASDASALASSDDPMIKLARAIDPRNRELRKRNEDEVEAVVRKASTQLAQARFAMLGANQYPDATGTLRLTWGPVKGYKDAAGKSLPWATDFGGAFKHATGQDPFKLPETWIAAKPNLKLQTPLDYVSTCDIHGGNSGSPTVNSKGEIIGIIFDSNIEGLPNRFVYTERQARAVHVASQGIVQALRDIYHADRVLSEIGFGKPERTTD